jgi:hypothetical protein
MSVNKNSRGLLVVNSLVTQGSQNWQWLYQFIEASGLTLADTILAPHYGTYKKLSNAQATKTAFVSTIQALGAVPSLQTIDVILNLHGAPNALYFVDGRMSLDSLRNTLAALNLKHKLRLLYSTASYGRSHADDFVAAGFTSANGAIGVNANSATEYPSVLTLWAAGIQFKDAIAAGENIVTRAPADATAKLMGFHEANSDKVIYGDSTITINSNR